MAGKPKSRRDRIVEMLRNPTPAQLKTLTDGIDPEKVAEVLSALVALLNRPPPDLPKVGETLTALAEGLVRLAPDPETAERIVNNAKSFEQQIKETRLVTISPILPVRLVSDPVAGKPAFQHDPALGIGGNFRAWLDLRSAKELESTHGKLINRYIVEEKGAGSSRTLYGVLRDYRLRRHKP